MKVAGIQYGVGEIGIWEQEVAISSACLCPIPLTVQIAGIHTHIRKYRGRRVATSCSNLVFWFTDVGLDGGVPIAEHLSTVCCGGDVVRRAQMVAMLCRVVIFLSLDSGCGVVSAQGFRLRTDLATLKAPFTLQKLLFPLCLSETRRDVGGANER